MKQETYNLLENYMLECMGDSAHDKDHIYRVLYNAMDIAQAEQNVDYDVLICACLLHDIGRKEQFENPKLCHAMVGGEKAYRFLIDNHFCKDFADKVKHCIQTHRYRQNNGVYHLVCDIIVRHTDGDYLIVQRDARKHYGGMWEASAGGSAFAGESPLQCAARELFEETGIRTDTLTEVGRVVDDECHST